MYIKSPSVLLVAFSIIIAACINDPEANEPRQEVPLQELELEQAFPNLSFTRPVDLQDPGDGSGRLFVLEQAGVIRVFDNDRDVTSADVFLDIQDRVRDEGNEEGLLGFTFHPDYADNGYFYVDYTASNPRRTVIARYEVDQDDPNRALKESEQVLLEVDQPYGNHNAGQIIFGPDGYLYITMGDGGAGGDPQENGQDRSTLLGSILRVDVDNPSGDRLYGIPSDNPFADNDQGYREEIYAYGLRNPWRISFDDEGRLWTGDVGQNAYEEIDIVESGENYGWNTMEGFHCFDPEEGCDESGLVLPIHEYPHEMGRSITGGFVYGGENVPELQGMYVYADYVSGRIWALASDGTENVNNEQIMESGLAISSFGTDADDELYILAFDGNIYRFTPTIDS